MIAITVCGNILLLSTYYDVIVLDPGRQEVSTKLRGQKVVINELSLEEK